MLHNCGSLRDGEQYCIKLVLRLLKKLKPQLKPLNSYHLKTICFWLQEEKEPAPHQWSDDQRGYVYHQWCYDQCKERLKDALSLLESYLKYQYCPLYFIRNVNLFKKFSHQTCAELALIVSNLKMNPETYRYLAKDVVPVEGEGWGVTADMYPPSQIRTPGSYPPADLGPPGPNPLADMYPLSQIWTPGSYPPADLGPPGPTPLADMYPPSQIWIPGSYPPADLGPPGPNPLADMYPPSQIWTPGSYPPADLGPPGPNPLTDMYPPSQIWTPAIGYGPPLPESKSASGYGPPFADLRPLPDFPFKHPLYHIW